MNLLQVKTNQDCIVKDILIDDFKTKIRIMELGLFKGVKIKVKHKSLFKKTLVIIFSLSCFTISSDIAKFIEADYV